jgi:hypothetical protein
VNNDAAPVVLSEPVEGPHRSVEIVRDEDVLSLALQHALEQVGSAVGIIAVIALVFSQLARARRAIARVRATASPARANTEPAR